MNRHHRLAALAGGLALLAGCASRPATPARPAPVSAQPGVTRPLSPAAGASGVTGATAQALVALFGPPALDLREGSARKLQFLNGNCVLDAYLYPRGRGEAVVTHVDVRLPDGRDADRAACIASLQRR